MHWSFTAVLITVSIFVNIRTVHSYGVGEGKTVKVISAQVRSIRLELDDVNYYRAYQYVVDVDQQLFVNGTAVDDAEIYPSDTYGPNVCWGNYMCNCLHPSSNRLSGKAILKTPSANITSNGGICAPITSASQPLFLVPLPPSEDPFRSFLSWLGVISSPVVLIPNRLAFLLFVEMRDQGRSTSRDVKLSGNHQEYELLVSGLELADGSPINIRVQKWAEYDLGRCDFLNFKQLSSELEVGIKEISKSTQWNQMNLFRWKVLLLTSCDAWTSCFVDASSRISQISKQYSRKTTYCPYAVGTDEWYLDPCCDPKAGELYCCAPRDIGFQANFLDSLLVNSSISCNNPFESESVILDLIDQYNAGIDPASGCVNSRRLVVNDELFYSSTTFIAQCHQLIFGQNQQRQCTVDAECYTRCIRGTCELPSSNWIDVHMKCYADRMPVQVKKYLEYYLGLPPNTNMEVFLATWKANLTTTNCQGPSSNQLTGIGRNYQTITPAQCYSDVRCNWKPSLNATECVQDSSPDFCGYCNGNGCAYLTIERGCYRDTSSDIVCSNLGGAYDSNRQLYPCKFDGYSDTETCLPRDVCPIPIIDDDLSVRNCKKDFCYSPLMDKTECLQMAYYGFVWEPTFASGSGLCILQGVTSQECFSIGVRINRNDLVWWYGRIWFEGWLETKPSCEAGTCVSESNYLVGKNMTSCDEAQFCTADCPSCVSLMGKSICYAYFDSTNCLIQGGDYDETEEICFFPYDREYCLYNDYIYEDCSMMTSTECFKCLSDPISCSFKQSILRCAIDLKNPCTKENCHTGGYCDNKFLYRQDARYGCQSPVETRFVKQSNWQCFGACTGYYYVDSLRTPVCQKNEFLSRSGCVNTEFNLEECYLADPMFNSYFTVGISQELCELTDYLGKKVEGCAGSPYDVLSIKSKQECEKCGGSYEQFYTWTTGSWKTGGRPLSTIWKAKAMEKVNEYGLTLDQKKVYTSVEDAIVLYYRSAFQTESLCRFNLLQSSLSYFSCDCTKSQGVPSTCFSTGAREVSVGYQRFCAGIEDWIQTGPFEGRIQESSVPSELICVDVEFFIRPVSQYRRNPSQSFSSDQLTGSGKKINNEYAVVKFNGYYIGQLVGDGIEFRGVSTLRNVSICITSRSEIPRVDSFTSPYFVYRMPNGAWVPILKSTFTKDGVFCINTDVPAAKELTSNVIFPALLDPNWSTYSDAVGSQSFVMILLVVESILCAYSGFLVFAKLTEQRGKMKLNLQLALFSLTFVFTLFRVIYFLLSIQDMIVDGSNTQLALYDFPIAIHFALYSTLVFYWAEISGDNTVNGSAFIKRLRLPFLLFNVILLCIFGSLLILNSLGEKDRHAEVILILYYSILSLLSGGIALGFLYYGGRLLHVLQEFKDSGPSKRQRKTSRKITIVTAITSVGLVAQSAWTLYSLFMDISSSTIICVAILFTEIIPCMTLLLTLGSFPRRPWTSSVAFVRGLRHRWNESTGSGSDPIRTPFINSNTRYTPPEDESET